ncbi:class I lanthipeptide [uncultured Kordia sp.]|uniref:class I lanthipeptide n=1 Tax=uncultured Kordia sp. TaxID=507699 RepID=UPI002602BE54|nr:class I lanthipeptide [uncultured Kordia sp.]
MKKKAIKGLALNKNSISNLNIDAINGGALGFTAGCSDGCSPFQTALNCTRANCTADCSGGGSVLCPMEENDRI